MCVISTELPAYQTTFVLATNRGRGYNLCMTHLISKTAPVSIQNSFAARFGTR